VFIRGSVVRYVHLPAAAVDIPLLEDATRRGKCTLYLSKDVRVWELIWLLGLQKRRRRVGREGSRGG